MARVYRRGSSWWVDIIIDGKRVRKSVGNTKKAAERRLLEMEQIRDSRQHAEHLIEAAQPHNAALPVAELMERFLSRCETLGRRPKTVSNYRTLIEGFLEVVGSKAKVGAITPAMSGRYIEARKALGISSRRVKHGLTAVGTMLNWGVREGILAYNPLRNLDRLEVEPVRERRALEDHEIGALLEKSPKHYRRLWVGFLTTGLRLSQLTGLRWGDIDFRRRTFRLLRSNTKNKRHYQMPMSEDFETALRELLAERGQDSPPPADGHCFLNAARRPWRNNLLKRFYRCCEEAGIEHHRKRADGVTEVVDLHSLRVSFASLLAENNVAPKVAQQLMQHSSVELTLGLYAKVRKGADRAAVDGLRIVSRGKEGTKKSQSAADAM